ncbi:hypothetical protein SAMN05443428_101271 [Caloramator quimbayensis]|uniref:Uncharacterized protein n=1 Tax=Caloramator quimbayensis TaxID=1147123 RepID=A0A1T4WHR2_9CLOT|nr:hypothetical protein [Caloramator quimbayensis]SKA76840.1 hypothetical protein SAMN05443428_101271 [Caloramator quimbayensis]
MGILYREIVDYKHRFLAKLTFILTLIIISVDVVVLVSNPKEFYNELIYAGYAMLPVALLISLILWQKCRIRYKYCIIDNELIIERIKGTKRKVELNLNVKNIVSIDKNSEKRSDIEKVYNFTCGCKRKDIYRCLFKKEGKLYSFYFAPSGNMLSRIEEMRSKNSFAS